MRFGTIFQEYSKRRNDNMGENKKDAVKFYSLTPILQKEAQYNIIFGERSNGKTYAILNISLRITVNTVTKEH